MASKTPIIGGILTSENNLSDVANAATARSNIGAGTGNGDMVGSNNLSDVANAATARSNIGAGTGNGNGDALTTNPLSQFAATTSAQLRGVMNDETGSGSLVFSDSPTFTTPNLGTASATQMTTTGNMIAQGQAYSQLNTLTPAAAIATDCNAGNVHKVTLNQNSTLSAPTNMVAGATYIWIIVQDGTRTLAYNSVFKFPGGTAPVLTTGATATDILSGVYDGTNIYGNMVNDVK